jgi:hypothetical protein
LRLNFKIVVLGWGTHTLFFSFFSRDCTGFFTLDNHYKNIATHTKRMIIIDDDDDDDDDVADEDEELL